MKVTRRTLMSSAAAPALFQNRKAPPNLLLILSDDHSAPYVGAYGTSWMSTPNLDRFAAEGMRFDRAFTAAPQCVPSRAALMTGRSPVAVRIGRFASPLPPEVVSLPDVLRAGNYYTGVCGRGFHLDGHAAGPVTSALYTKYGLRTWRRRVDYLDSSTQNDVSARFREFLSRVPKGRPWFFWINYNDPHFPWDRGAGRVTPQAVEVPPQLPDLPGVRDALARYCGEIERMDGLFGEHMEILARNGAENTLVMFMGDNGMAFPHGKGSLYDPGLNVPLLVRWPGRIKPGATRSLVSGEDLAPTFIEAAGGQPPREVSGRSFLGLLTGGDYERRPHIFGARLHHGYGPIGADTKADSFDLSRCIRSDRWKFIYNCTPHMEYVPVDCRGDALWREMVAAHQAGQLKPEHERAYFQRPRPFNELYDLEKDPAEMENLAGKPEHREVQLELMSAMQEKMTLDYDFLPPPIAN